MEASKLSQVGELTYEQISNGRRWFILILASIGSVIIYAPAYLKAVFYTPLQQALGLDNTQMGAVFGSYAIAALICYLPSGIIADKVRMRTLASAGFISTAVLVGIYATLPKSLVVLYLIFIGMGITTIFIWWGVRYKLVRLVSLETEYPKRIGLSYGIYGLAGLLITLIATGIVAMVGTNMKLGVSVYLWFLAIVILILGILSWLLIPKFAGEIKPGGGFNLSEFVQAVKNPVVWIAALSVFFVYFFYTGVTYTTPYMTQVLGAGIVVTTIVSAVRTYGITVLSGPIFGAIANKLKPSITIIAGSILFAVGVLLIRILPGTAAMVVIVAIIMIVLGFLANGAFAVVSAQLTEGKVPVGYFGAATGLLSIIGFLPDTFSSTWFGSIMDKNKTGDTVSIVAYQQIFWILIAAAIIAAVVSLLLWLYLKGKRAKGELVDEPEVPLAGATGIEADAEAAAKDVKAATSSAEAVKKAAKK